ncbi:DUF6705 family protein [Chryseobacterium sp. SIMBA_028]|uniref:DUF6705 family protein n=1 Tax=Chryseobacterium sp. SIMBA_028 TaxID=3085771 RepID=UPI00397C3A56
MKNKFLIVLFFVGIFCNAQQIFSLRPTETSLPEGSYQKDTNNELPDYEGTWKGIWNSKTIFVTFKKLIQQPVPNLNYYKDYLVGKFKIIDANGSILFDNTNISDSQAKIKGLSFKRYGDRYMLSYVDPDLCNRNGSVTLKFTDSSKTQINWNLYFGSNMITSDCQYYNTDIPDSLPEEIILTKQ